MASIALSNMARAKREYNEEDTAQDGHEDAQRTSFDLVESTLEAEVVADELVLEGFLTQLDDKMDVVVAALDAEEIQRAADYNAYKAARDNRISAVQNYGDNLFAGEVAGKKDLNIDGGSLKLGGYLVKAVISGGAAFISVGE